MKQSAQVLLDQAETNMKSALSMLMASYENVKPFIRTKQYSPEELEPYDAMCDRFIRAVEMCLKYFRTIEYSHYAEQSDTLRDLLNRMHKLAIISEVDLWFAMRDVRNRIVHAYLPDALHEIYRDIMVKFKSELVSLNQRGGKR